MDITHELRRPAGMSAVQTAAVSAVRTISIPALIGAGLGALAAWVLPNGDQGDVMSSTPAASRS